MRAEFRDLISGWTLISGFNAITNRLEELSNWIINNQPLEEDEQKTVELMVKYQIARGIEEGIGD